MKTRPLPRLAAAVLAASVAAAPCSAQTVSGAASAIGAVPAAAAGASLAAPTPVPLGLVPLAGPAGVTPGLAGGTPASWAAPSIAPALGLSAAVAPAALELPAPAPALAAGAATPAAEAPAALPAPPQTAPGAKAAPARAARTSLALAAPGGQAAPRTTLSAARGAAPELSGPRAASTLERLFSGAAKALETVSAARSPASGRLERARAAALSRASDPARPADKLSFEEFGRAGEQTFYGGRLAEGQHGAVVAAPSRVQPEELPGEGEMRRRMELPTLSNPQREEKAVELLQLAGAAKEVVTLKPGQAPPFDVYHTVFKQDAGRNRNNFIVVKPGRRPEKVIVVGAHHDKVSVGEGKIDNWSGATMVANLYQAMRDVDTDATYVFVMFAREEEGLIGSQVFVRSLAKDQRARIKAMVNIDTIAVDGTYSWQNNSSKFLLDLIAKVAREKGLDHKPLTLWGGDADSSSFKGWTNAMTVFGASIDVIWDIIHSENDNMGAFSLPHYVNTAKLVFELLKSLDAVSPPAVARGGAGLGPRASRMLQ